MSLAPNTCNYNTCNLLVLGVQSMTFSEQTGTNLVQANKKNAQ